MPSITARPSTTPSAPGPWDSPPLSARGALEVRAISTPTERAAWTLLTRAHPTARVVYPTYSIAAGWSPVELGLFDRGALTAGLLLLIQRAGHLPFSLSRVVSLMVGPRDHAEQADHLLSGVETLALQRRIIETDVSLRIPANDVIPGFGWHAPLLETFRRHGYDPLPRVDRSYFVRVDRSDTELLASFGQKVRNRIKKAHRDGSRVTATQDTRLLGELHAAYAEMAERKEIRVVLPRDILVRGLSRPVRDGEATIFVERYGARVANLMVVDLLGTPCAMVASRTNENVDREIPSSAQSLYFAVMREARARGAAWLDLGGCEGRIPVESHPNFGVWHFKHGFKGEYVTFLPHLRKVRGGLPHRLLPLIHRWRGDPVCT